MKMKLIICLSALFFAYGAQAKIMNVGTFTIPKGDTVVGPATPGKSFEFDVTVSPGDKLHIATMYGVSNDWFFSTPTGLQMPTYFEKNSYDVTGSVALYDAGTETDENLLNAPNNGPNQTGPNMGLPDRVGYVRSLGQFESFKVSNFLTVRVYDLGADCFHVVISVKENSPTGVSPGVFWVERNSAATSLFEINRPAKNNGLEALAEDGNFMPLYMYLKSMEGDMRSK